MEDFNSNNYNALISDLSILNNKNNKQSTTKLSENISQHNCNTRGRTSSFSS